MYAFYTSDTLPDNILSQLGMIFQEDLQNVPVQPDEKFVIDWERDLIWDILEKKASRKVSNRDLILNEGSQLTALIH
jgi:hypothetical protein